MNRRTFFAAITGAIGALGIGSRVVKAEKSMACIDITDASDCTPLENPDHYQVARRFIVTNRDGFENYELVNERAWAVMPDGSQRLVYSKWK